MEGFDILYLMKTPFFMGNTHLVPAEANQCDVNEEDQTNMTEKNLLLLRALTVMNDLEGLKNLVQGLVQGETPQKANAQGFTILAQYLIHKKVQDTFIDNSLQLLETNSEQVTSNQTLMILLAYYLLAQEDYNKLFSLLNKTRNPEFLAVKVVAQLRINRPDLAEGTLRTLKSVDEDNCLTVLAQTWIHMYKSGMQSNLDELISQMNQLSERVGGYTLKTYNLLGCSLMLKGDIDRAIKIFENAVNELQLESEDGQAKLASPNADLACLISNYVKCIAIQRGQGQGFEFFKNDPTTKQLFGYLARIDPSIGSHFFERRQQAEAMFDQALASM